MIEFNNIEEEQIFWDAYFLWQKDWNLFAKNVLKVSLDKEQREILSAIQTERRVSIRSGTARGKDFVSAVAAICFLYLTVFDEDKKFYPTKVVLTAPTGRQIKNIMIPEITKNFTKAGWLPGSLYTDGIRFDEKGLQEWFLTGFKAADGNVEAWSGIHAPNVMVVVTEASGISDETFDSIEGILQGNSRLVFAFNPNNTTGEAYRSTRSKQYKSFRLNCFNSPNVKAKKILIPGQVDYEWVKEKIEKGWAQEIRKEEMLKAKNDFEFDGKYFRPNNLFKIKVLGEFPEEGEDVLIPFSWLELSNNRWIEETKLREGKTITDPLRLGVDIAGMGRDNNKFCFRYGNYIEKIESLFSDKSTIHMQAAGKIKHILENQERKNLERPNVFNTPYAFIDTIGEGAGVYSRLQEQGVMNAISFKSSFKASNLTDSTGEFQFVNLRAYAFWKLREALDPDGEIKLAMPISDMLVEDLSEMKWFFTSDGKIGVEKKDDIVKRIGRSPDEGDSVAISFYPEEWLDYIDESHENTEQIDGSDLGMVG